MKLSDQDKIIIQQYLDKDIGQLPLLLQKEDCDSEFIYNQIKGRKKLLAKVPTWASNSNLIFPKALSIEQSSSEWTAKRKSRLFSKSQEILDMTGGMGIDAYFISKSVKSYTLIERQKELCSINKHNFEALGADNIEVIEGESLEFLLKNQRKYDLIYLDPARRSEDNSKRVFLLEDFSPNIFDWQDSLWQHTDEIIIKLAPMLDISSLVKKLPLIYEIYVFAWKNEVKEIVVKMKKTVTNRLIFAINLLGKTMNESSYSSKFDERRVDVALKGLKNYIYEPNRAILKAQLQDKLAREYSLSKMHNNTQFYCSDEFRIDYPGRIFMPIQSLPSKLKSFRKVYPSDKANIISRNHPLKSQDLHKRFQLSSGGDQYILAFTGYKNKKEILEVTRLK